MRSLQKRKPEKQRQSWIGDILSMLAVIVLAGFLLWQTDEQEDVQVAAPNTISGHAEITDGDSIRIHGQRIRITGIDAPELKQYCHKDGQRFACGKLSRAHLTRLVNKQPVTCKWLEKDLYNRILGSCLAGSTDLNRSMVLDGWAISYSSYPHEESFARREKRGIWQWQFERPRAWRRAHPIGNSPLAYQKPDHT